MSDASKRFEPRWPATVALLSVGLLQLALPEPLSLGPGWLLIAVVGVLLIPTIWTLHRGFDRTNTIMGYVLASIVTADMVWSLYRLVTALLSHQIAPPDLLRASAALWISNILVFASWYWRLDAGGPHARERRGAHTDGAFLFPQMTLNREARKDMDEQNWSPGFIDYRILAHRLPCSYALGQSPDDGPVAHLPRDRSSARGACRQYSLDSLKRRD